MGQTDTDIRVLGKHFHSDHRLETTSSVLPHAHTLIRALNTVATVIHDFSYVNHGSSTHYIIDMPNRKQHSAYDCKLCSYCPIFP
jgi:hypothetical protein